MSIGVVVMAYGGPDKLDDVEPYLLDVRGGRATSQEVVHEVRERYRKIGGRSPILEQTREQAAAIENVLEQTCSGLFKVEVGMRHWHPFIPDVVGGMQRSGVDKFVGVVMAPHYSSMSIGAYERKLREAAGDASVVMIHSWGLLPSYLDAIAENVSKSITDNSRVLFTAHSLPERIVGAGDPYKDELLETVDALRERLPSLQCDFAFQSAGMSSEPWLGPDAGDVLRLWGAAGIKDVVVCAIGFVSEHVEILYDLDIELQDIANQIGVNMTRAPMIGANSAVMTELADLVLACAQQEDWIAS
jgi:protoporphyrin/coproporphyrin ferrochelatase